LTAFFFSFSIKEKIERASGGDNGMAEKRVGWLAGFLSRKKENWGFLSFKTLGNKPLALSSLSSFTLFPGPEVVVLQVWLLVLLIVVVVFHLHSPLPHMVSFPALWLSCYCLVGLLSLRDSSSHLVNLELFSKSGTQHTWEFVFFTVS